MLLLASQPLTVFFLSVHLHRGYISQTALAVCLLASRTVSTLVYIYNTEKCLINSCSRTATGWNFNRTGYELCTSCCTHSIRNSSFCSIWIAMQSEAETNDKEEEPMQVLFTCFPGLEFPHSLDFFWGCHVSSPAFFHFMHQPSNVLLSGDTHSKSNCTHYSLVCASFYCVHSNKPLPL